MEIDMRTEREYIEKQRLTMIDEKGIKYWACEEVGELIRCKDCKFFDRLTSELTFCTRGSTEEEPNAMVMTENDYCSHAERKEEIDNG